MKKVYTMMAAVATSLSMIAAPAAVKPMMVDANREAQKLKEQMSQITMVYGTKETGKKKLPAKPDLNAFYGSFFVSAAQSDNGFRTGALKFEQKSATEVLIYGLYSDYPAVAQYDAASMSLTVKSGQVLCPADLWGGEDLILKLCVSGGPNGLTETDKVTWTYDPNGRFGVENSETKESFEIENGLWRLNDGDQYTYFVATMESIFPSAYAFRYFYTPFGLDEEFPTCGNFTFNADEWIDLGQSQFVDGWFADPLLFGDDEEECPSYGVQTYVKKTSKSLTFLLSQPYNKNSIMYQADGQDTPDAEGYIYIDATDRDCVLVRPHIACGLASEVLFDCLTPLTLTTTDGISYYIEDVDIDDIKDEADMWGDDLSTLDEDGLITLVKCRFQTVADFYEENYWIESRENPVPVNMTSTIQLPSDWEEKYVAGVDGIFVDSEMTVKRFFNLQGIEVANPAAGEIIIVKDGNKTSKVIF